MYKRQMFCHKSHPGREDYSQAGTVGYIIDSTDFMFQCMGDVYKRQGYPTNVPQAAMPYLWMPPKC